MAKTKNNNLKQMKEDKRFDIFSPIPEFPFYFNYDEDILEAHNAIVCMNLEEKESVPDEEIQKTLEPIYKMDRKIFKSWVAHLKKVEFSGISILDEIKFFSGCKAPGASLCGILYGCKQYGYFENFDPFDIDAEKEEYPVIYKKVEVYASLLKSYLEKNTFREDEYTGSKYVLRGKSNLTKQLNYTIAYLFECLLNIPENKALSEEEQFRCYAYWNKYIFTRDIDIATWPFICRIKHSSKREMIKYGNSLFDRLTDKKLPYQEATIISILLSLDTVLTHIKKERYKEAINHLSKIQSIHSIQSDYNAIPKTGGETTANYWKQEENKLKEEWLTFPKEVQKSNKESINLLSAKTRLGYRTIEGYIRNWRKDTQG